MAEYTYKSPCIMTSDDHKKLKMVLNNCYDKVQVGKDQEKAQSAKDSHFKNPRWEKTKLTIRYLYHENICKPNEQLFAQ